VNKRLRDNDEWRKDDQTKIGKNFGKVEKRKEKGMRTPSRFFASLAAKIDSEINYKGARNANGRKEFVPY